MGNLDGKVALITGAGGMKGNHREPGLARVTVGATPWGSLAVIVTA